MPSTLPPVGDLQPISPHRRHIRPRPSSVTPMLWTAALAPFAAAVLAFGWLTWRTVNEGAPDATTPAVVHAAGAESRTPAAQHASPTPTGVAELQNPIPAAPTPGFIPLRTLETPDVAPSIEPETERGAASDDSRPAIPTQEPTPIATPGPFPPPAGSPPVRIRAPAIELDAPVTAVGTYTVREGQYLVRYHEVADDAAGWHEDSARPGAAGNTVLAGHNNTRGEVFRHLVDVEPDDMIYLEAEGRQYPYRVAKKLVLPETFVSAEQQYENARWIAPTNDMRLTLVSCWPYVSNTHRVIVVAVPAGTGEAEVARR